MDAPTKRQCEGSGDSEVSEKRMTLSDISDYKLRNFIDWCRGNNFNITHKLPLTASWKEHWGYSFTLDRCPGPGYNMGEVGICVEIDNSSVPERRLLLESCFQFAGQVRIGQEGSCAQYGMVAVEDIAEGYCLFQVPRSNLLMPTNTDIAALISKDQAKLSATNQWIPLLVSLLYEQNLKSSKWRPYLDLVPDFQALDLPLFWESSEVEKHLKGTGVDLAVERDLRMIESDYKNLVLPFFQRNEDSIHLQTKDFEFFKKMVAFVMAYSFTEPQNSNQGDDEDDDSENEEAAVISAPMMVPVADILNHVTRNNAKLTFGKEALKMVTTRPVKKGEEIYNTYGQVSNLHLMHMYGFAEPFPNNVNDVVEIPVSRLLAAVKEGSDGGDAAFLDKKWKFLLEMDVVADDDMFVLGKDGIITDDTCVETLKVLTMSRSEFEDYVTNGGWSDAESDSSNCSESTLDFAAISRLNTRWKSLLKRMGELHLEGYPTSLADDEKQLKSASSLLPRDRYALYLAHGQKMLLKSLLDLCVENNVIH